MTFKYKVKCVTIRDDQEEFIHTETEFKLSRFLQTKLDEWINVRKMLKEFKKEVDLNEKKIE